MVKYVIKNGLKTGTLLNVNVPDLPEEEILGVKVTSQGNAKWNDVYEERTDPYGRSYFWLTGVLETENVSETSDIKAIDDKYISISPIHFDLTDYEYLEELKVSVNKEFH